jgi:hypothetical protein
MGPSKIEGFHGKLRPRFGRCLAVCGAAASLFFLISCPSAFAAGQHAFAIKVVTSLDDQFWTNSVIIEGTHEVMLVDAQLTKTKELGTTASSSSHPTGRARTGHNEADWMAHLPQNILHTASRYWCGVQGYAGAHATFNNPRHSGYLHPSHNQ